MADQQRIVRKCCCLHCQHSYSRRDRPRSSGDQSSPRLAQRNEGGGCLQELLAHERGRGGMVEVATITGMSRTTIRHGMLEIERAVPESCDRVRRPGGGRKRIEKKLPIVIPALREVVADETAGDPITGLRWTHKTTRKVAEGVEPTWIPGEPYDRCPPAAAG